MKAYGTGNTKCAKYNWIYNWLPKDTSKTPTYATYPLRLLGPAYGTSSTWVVMNEGYFSTGSVTMNSYVVWPALYLKSTVLIVGGAGTAANPWRVALG